MTHHPYSRRPRQPVRRSGLVCLGCAASLLAFVRSEASQAQASPAERTRVQLRVESAGSCASEHAIAARVRRRSTQIVFASTGPYDASLRISVEPEGGGKVQAVLRVQHEGRGSERRIEAASCADAVDALGLLIVLTLDPAAASGGEPSPGAEVTSSPDAPKSSRSVRRPSREPTREPQAQPAPQPPAQQRSPTAAGTAQTASAADPAANGGKARAAASSTDFPRDRDSSASSAHALPTFRPAHWALAAGVAGHGLLGAAPSLMPGIGLFLQLAWEREGPWSPAVSLAATHGWLPGVREPGGRADFELQRVRLDLCVVRWRSGPAAVRGCGSGALGRFSASGSETYDPAAYVRALATLGGRALLSVELPAQLALHAALGFGVPWSRDAFAFRPEVFHRVALVVVDLELGVGARFP